MAWVRTPGLEQVAHHEVRLFGEDRVDGLDRIADKTQKAVMGGLKSGYGLGAVG